jgi:hypothetical protein
MKLCPVPWFFRLFHTSSSGFSSGEYGGRWNKASLSFCSATNRATDLARCVGCPSTIRKIGAAALARVGWKPGDLDLIEANEAFAAQACAVNKDIGWDTAKVNVNGGAIAIGHPIGASGARILVTLLYEMQRRGAHKGLATLCVGGGMGVAAPMQGGINAGWCCRAV